MYALDTNACIHLLNGSSTSLRERLAARSPGQIRIFSIVRAELLQGARLSSRVAENLRLVARFLQPFVSVAFDDDCAEKYAEVRSELRREGRMIGPNDLLIAASALTHNLTLVTHNVEEFSRVSGLLIEDWEG